MTIHERIRSARISCELTQEDAADMFGITQSAWSKIESGKLEPGLELLKRIKKHFKVSYDYILEGVTAKNTVAKTVSNLTAKDLRHKK